MKKKIAIALFVISFAVVVPMLVLLVTGQKETLFRFFGRDGAFFTGFCFTGGIYGIIFSALWLRSLNRSERKDILLGKPITL